MGLRDHSEWLSTWKLTNKLTENLRRVLPEQVVEVPWTVKIFLRTKHVGGIFKASLTVFTVGELTVRLNRLGYKALTSLIMNCCYCYYCSRERRISEISALGGNNLGRIYGMVEWDWNHRGCGGIDWLKEGTFRLWASVMAENRSCLL